MDPLDPLDGSPLPVGQNRERPFRLIGSLGQRLRPAIGPESDRPEVGHELVSLEEEHQLALGAPPSDLADDPAAFRRINRSLIARLQGQHDQLGAAGSLV